MSEENPIPGRRRQIRGIHSLMLPGPSTICKDYYLTSPKSVRIAPARYPRDAEGRNSQHMVTVMLTIDAQGRVPEAEVLEGVRALNEAALACVKEWRFKPAQRRGVPVGTVMVAPVMFLMTPPE